MKEAMAYDEKLKREIEEIEKRINREMGRTFLLLLAIFLAGMTLAFIFTENKECTVFPEYPHIMHCSTN